MLTDFPATSWRCVIAGCVQTFPTFTALQIHEYTAHGRRPLGAPGDWVERYVTRLSEADNAPSR